MDYAAQLSMVLPEIVLSVGGLALLMIAAWGGQAVSRLVSWVAVLVLIGAGVALTGPASSGGLAFDKLLSLTLACCGLLGKKFKSRLLWTVRE